MNFIAIDFETANYRPDSACQIGIAVVRDNIITENRSWLIKPPFGGFNYFNTQIHGITASDVENEPMFDELWKTIKPYFVQNNLLVAHNAGFDTSVLFHTLKTFEITVPDLTVACTIAMARRTWYGERSYSLGALAEKFGIKFLHHDAGEDARACADIALRVLDAHNLNNITLNADTVEKIEADLGIYFGSIEEHGYLNCRTRPKSKK